MTMDPPAIAAVAANSANTPKRSYQVNAAVQSTSAANTDIQRLARNMSAVTKL